MAVWVPDAGEIVWVHFDPPPELDQAGHEQAGHRPALVLSPLGYNRKRGMMISCPMTSRIKGYAFEVVVSRDPPSAVLADQINCLDWQARRATRKGRASAEVLAEVRAKLGTLLKL